MDSEPSFMCDAMLGGLARWLRAAGYGAVFDAHIADGELVRRSLEERLCLLTSDSGVLERYAVVQGLVRCVFVPKDQPPVQQLAHVMRELDLGLRRPRCMKCGGELEDVSLDQVEDQVPPKVRAACDRFFRCVGCGKAYWRGTHWRGIRQRLRRAVRLARGSPP